jgi:hypothetical protein
MVMMPFAWPLASAMLPDVPELVVGTPWPASVKPQGLPVPLPATDRRALGHRELLGELLGQLRLEVEGRILQVLEGDVHLGAHLVGRAVDQAVGRVRRLGAGLVLADPARRGGPGPLGDLDVAHAGLRTRTSPRTGL